MKPLRASRKQSSDKSPLGNRKKKTVAKTKAKTPVFNSQDFPTLGNLNIEEVDSQQVR